ncbi:metal-dependent hydrolase family protein [Engelhardtia mirabilis]|uniref:Imidazolonepropionase n=1 Tax=Engelhardtia mirabilis TaxID=2528011 RepID=A0A518BEB0_9BACT|nr:imidazolonepropionase [Planctomycetes bacterium Pla133]QDU99650.1 imidazolonepropionase [Planctomycetes bacterium Pla86]
MFESIAACALVAALFSGSSGSWLETRPIAPPAASQVETASTKVLHCGGLLAVPGQEPLRRMTVVVRGDRIVDVREGYVTEIDGAATPVDVIDLRDAFVLPGLIDCHTHLTGQSVPVQERIRRTLQETEAHAAIDGVVYAERTLMAGFTTVRNVGSQGSTGLALRDRIASGMIPGPRMLVSGPSVTVTGGHGDWTNSISPVLRPERGPETMTADGPDEVRKAVRARVREGVDLIKITATGGVLSMTAAGVDQQFFQDELDAIVEAANRMGRKVAAHAHGADGIKSALRAGVSSIEHGTYLDDEAIALFVETGAYLVPTIHAGKYVVEKAQVDGYYPPEIRSKAAAVGPLMQAALGRAYRGGVKLAFGTDVGVGAHGTNALEFVYMHEAGVTPADCLVSATVNAADLCGIGDQVGTLEPGKLADIIAVRANPLQDLTALQDVPFVMKAGTVYKGEF